MTARAGMVIGLILLFPFAAIAGRIYDPSERVIGYRKSYTLKKNESLVEIARRFGVGFNEISDANPGVDPFVPDRGTRIVLPVSWIVPDVPPTAGIVINLSELRLYYFYNAGGKRKMITFPVGIGVEGNSTPLGTFRIKEKREAPSWRVPQSIRRERPELPPVVPPGEDNPLGSHAFRLSEPSILIHGTNRPLGVGRRVSHGCIRLYPEDIAFLYDRASVEESVLILRQPVKVGTKSGRVFVEVHHDPEENDYLNHAVSVLKKQDLLFKVSFLKLSRAIDEKSGLPVDITRDDAKPGER